MTDDPTIAALQAEIVALRAQLQAEQQRSGSESYLRALLSAMQDVVLVIGDDGTYLDIPPTSPDLLYAPSTTLLGQTLTMVMPSAVATHFMTVIREVLATGDAQRFTYALPVQQGEAWFDATVSGLTPSSVLWVARDITPLMRAEAQQRALQAEVIEAQQAALRELTTPLIPVADGVVVMPLVGTIDSGQAKEITERLLEGITRHRARVAIVDITGVRVVDTQVANGLITAAAAVRLLGAQVVLTGIRPEIAQTLVGLGVDLHNIVTHSTLQRGVAYALGHDTPWR